jgi:hypothetical protein
VLLLENKDSEAGFMSSQTRHKFILLAIRPDDRALVSAALGSEFNILVCHTCKEAQALLHKDIALIACGVHFDYGAMFDLLRAAKANSDTQSVPFFLLIADGSRYSERVLKGIRTAAKVLGATGLVDLSKLKLQLGEKQAYEALRHAVKDALSSAM